jgi:hypothetical protein
MINGLVGVRTMWKCSGITEQLNIGAENNTKYRH